MEIKKIKILAIDDNTDNLIVLKALINESFPETEFYPANSGIKGIELCRSVEPDVIFLDIVMPGMDGYEVCELLKSDTRLKNIPVVMATANRADKDGRIRALEAGADAFLQKPVDESELKAQIRAMLRIKESEDMKREEKIRLENMVKERTQSLELELADRKKAEKKLILSLDKITRNKLAIMNLMEDLKSEMAERKQFEKELVKSKEKAEESDRLKTAFLHNISHEIRTPMNAIIGFSSLLNDPDLDKESQSNFIEIITQSSTHLLSIVSDIIEISNIEAGIVKITKKRTDLYRVMNNLHKQFMNIADGRGLEFRVIIDSKEKETFIDTDETKLIQIISNLLSNAFKFTKKGQVDFGFNISKGFLEFRVSDTGIGISEDHRNKIFDRFYQVENAPGRLYEGTGLGLSISKAYAELLGGKMWVDSLPGKGSTFFFTIPLEGKIVETDIKNVEEKNAKTLFQGNKTILIAEDEENNFRLIKQQLSKHNLILIHALNGKEAVEICNREKNIDLILMDIKMPVMDGYEATAIIKKKRPSLPIIAQTAFAFETDKEKALDAGCDDYISKPFKRETLLELVNKYCK